MPGISTLYLSPSLSAKQIKCFDPWVRVLDQTVKSPPLECTPPSLPHGVYIDRCLTKLMRGFAVLRTFSITLSWFPWISSPLMPHAIALSTFCNNYCPQNCCFHHFCCFHWGLWILSCLMPKHSAFFCNFPQNCCFCSCFYWGLWTLSYLMLLPSAAFCNNLLSKLLLRSLDPFMPYTIAFSNFLKFSSKLLFLSLSGGSLDPLMPFSITLSNFL